MLFLTSDNSIEEIENILIHETSLSADLEYLKCNNLSKLGNKADIVNEKYVIVKTLLLKTDKKPEVKIDWRVYTKDPQNPLIRDLIVEGLSLARTQKEEFASILSSNNNKIEILIERLEDFATN